MKRLCFLAGMILGVTGCAQTPAPSPAKPEFHAVAETPAALDSTPSDMAVLNRISWGADTADAQALAATGLKNYLTAQLNPSADDGLPPDAAAQIAAMEISQKPLI